MAFASFSPFVRSDDELIFYNFYYNMFSILSDFTEPRVNNLIGLYITIITRSVVVVVSL